MNVRLSVVDIRLSTEFEARIGTQLVSENIHME